jgi:hypothetical protein
LSARVPPPQQIGETCGLCPPVAGRVEDEQAGQLIGNPDTRKAERVDRLTQQIAGTPVKQSGYGSLAGSAAVEAFQTTKRYGPALPYA